MCYTFTVPFKEEIMAKNIDNSVVANSALQSVLYDIENSEDTNAIALLGRALSSPVRIEILRMLNQKPMLLSEIANTLDLQLSSAAFHLRVLEDAGLTQYEFSTKRKGTLKWYSYSLSKNIILQMRAPLGANALPEHRIMHVPIGDYIDAEFDFYCGFASEKQQLMENEPHKAFITERHSAQILWSRHSGFVTYALPNDYATDGELNHIALSAELCAETNGYNNDYPSDITFWINGIELCTWTCPGDFGDRYGKYTPEWWYLESTKYGLLTNITVKKTGVYLNEQLINKQIGLSDLHLSNGNRTTFRIGVKKDAKHRGGFNLFGDQFGDFHQPIIFTASYKTKK